MIEVMVIQVYDAVIDALVSFVAGQRSILRKTNKPAGRYRSKLGSYFVLSIHNVGSINP